MRLISALLGFALRKLGLLVALVLSLFLSYLLVQALIPPLREAVADRGRLQQVAAERQSLENDLDQLRDTTIASIATTTDDEIEQGLSNVADQKAKIANLRDTESEQCGLLDKIIAAVVPGDPCQLAQAAVATANDTLDTFEGNLGEAQDAADILRDPDLSPQQKLDALRGDGNRSAAERAVANKRSELAQKQAEQASLEQAQTSGAGWVVNQFDRTWKWLLALALIALLLPAILRTVSYFVLMPVVSRMHTPIDLAEGSDDARAELRTTAALRTLRIQLEAGEVLSARSEHVRPVQGKVRSQLLYDWTSPFISFAAGLYGLSRLTGDEQVTSATLSTPDDPDSYLMRIDFAHHPGVVMHPRHVVGVIGTPTLTTRWRWGIQSLATWQVRYIMFAGSGSLIVQGSGDVVAESPAGRPMRMEQTLMMGFDSRLSKGINRTEVFWPYLWGKTPLVDDEFTGDDAFFWQKSSADGPSNPIARVFDVFFSALGKLLGF